MPVNPTTKVGIINNALVRLGQAPISSLSDPKAEAIAADAVYTQVKRDALNKNDWTFALREAQPAELATPQSDFSDTRFNHAYPFPNDGLRVLGITDRSEYQESFGLELWTAATNPQFIYIADVDEGSFPPEFVTWMVLELAGAFALTITQDITRAEFFQKAAVNAWVDAKGVDAQRDSPLRLIYEDMLNSGFTARF